MNDSRKQAVSIRLGSGDIRKVKRLAERLARQFPVAGEAVRQGPVPLFWPGLIPRNLLFLAVVLGHGFRRLLPPY